MIFLYSWLPIGIYLKILVVWIFFFSKFDEFGPFFSSFDESEFFYWWMFAKIRPKNYDFNQYIFAKNFQ